MIVNVFNQQLALKISKDQVERLVEKVLHEEGQSCDEVNIYFVDTSTICQLHEQFFQDPSPTDCISFPMDEQKDETYYRILGEVFVCPDTALEYSRKHKTNPYEETSLYIIHGLLHLMGYDDNKEKDRNHMRQAEVRHMQILKINGWDLQSLEF